MLAAAELDAADDAVEQAEPDAAKPDKQPGRLNAAERERLLAQLRDARTRRKQAETKQPPTEIGRKHDPKTGEVPRLEKDYIREQMHELVEVFRECYNSRLVDQPDLAGTIKVEIALVGEPDVGGVVEDVAIIVDETTLNDPFMTECVQQTIYTLELPPPADGGTATIRYPIVFEPADEE
jgi:hypothetical protein